MVQTLPTYIALPDAAQRYHISEEALTHAVEAGTIRAVQAFEGGVWVALEDVGLLALSVELDPELRGKPIRAAEAVEKYAVSDVNLSRWVEAGYLRVIERGPKLLVLDEADVKRAAAIFHRAQQETGSFVRAGWVLKRRLRDKDQ